MTDWLKAEKIQINATYTSINTAIMPSEEWQRKINSHMEDHPMWNLKSDTNEPMYKTERDSQT